MKQKQKIAVAVAGGGDKTYVFAGILHYLQQKYDIVEISTISGSSYTVPLALSRGTLNSVAASFQKLNILDFAKILKPEEVLEKRGVMEIDPRFFRYIESLTGIKNGRTSTPKFTPYAVDISNPEGYRTVDTSRMPFGVGVAASIALPFLFAPIRHGNLELVDGGIGGNVNLGIFKKYAKIPKVVLMHTSDQGPAMIKTLLAGIRYMKVPFSTVTSLHKLIKNEPKLFDACKRAPNINLTNYNANFIFNLHNVSEGLLLSESAKKKLLVEGYMMADHIYSTMDYFIRTGLWKKLENENVIDLNFDKFRIN